MKYGGKIFYYQWKHDFFCALIFCAIAMCLAVVVDSIFEGNFMNIEMMFFIMIEISANDLFSSNQYGFYSVFGFSRKVFYHQQTILLTVRAAVFALYQAICLTIGYEDCVNMYIEGTTETADMYHRIPIWEIFLYSLLLFCMFEFIKLIWNTGIHAAYSVGEKYSQQQIYRRERAKKKHKWLYKIGYLSRLLWFIVIAVFLIVGFLSIYRVQLTSEFSVRLKIMLAYGVGILVLYFLGRWKYRPKYL